MELNTSTSGDKSASGAADGTKDEANSTGGEGANDAFQKLLKEKKNTAEKNRQLEAELKAYKEKEMLAKEQYQELIKARDEELSQYKQKVEEFDRMKKQATINSALRDELVKLGVDTKHMDTALRLIDKDRIQLDSDTNTVVGAIEAVKTFHQKNADLGFFQRKQPGVNHDAPNVNVSTSPDEAFKIELRACKTQKEIDLVMKKYKKV